MKKTLLFIGTVILVLNTFGQTVNDISLVRSLINFNDSSGGFYSDYYNDALQTFFCGAVIENLGTVSSTLTALKIGDRLKAGEVILEITQIGKECHNSGCAIKKLTGDCIMPKEGLFSKAITEGVLKKGSAIECL